MYKKILLLLALQTFWYVNAQVVINELDADTPSTDVLEFIELKSNDPLASLDGYCLVFYNGGSNGLNNVSYFAVDLDGMVTDGNGILLLSNSLVNPSGSYIFQNNTIQNGPDAVAIYIGDASDFPINTPATSSNLIDALVYSNSSTTTATNLMSILNVTTSYNENVNGASASQSIQRKNDGFYEVKSPTPRVTNDGSGIEYNGITTTFSTGTIVSEGQSIVITFTTATPVTSNINFSITLNNGSFNSSDFIGSLSISIPAGSTTTSTTIQILNDNINDGDEEIEVKIGAVPPGYIVLNNNNILRVIDANFQVLPFGTPANPTYGAISSTAPIGYYSSLEGKSGASLKQAIQDIIANPNVVRAHTYGDVIDLLKTADQNPANNNQVWLIYNEQPRSKLDYQSNSGSLGKWNREHIYCQSRGNFGDLYNLPPDGMNVWSLSGPDDIGAGLSDAHHLRVVDSQENSSRNNRNYGIDYNGPLGNLANTWRGDVSRACFYMAVRYTGLTVVNGNPTDGTVGEIGDLATLLSWNQTDPSDDFEMNRNNFIYTWQINRNPFIDYPTLADYIWGANAGQTWFAPLSNQEFNPPQIVVFPNPVKDKFFIKGIVGEAKIEVFSTLGQKVFEGNFNSETLFDLNLTAGIYHLKITHNGIVASKKVVFE